MGKQRFVDGGLRCNNPVEQVLTEAHILFHSRVVACVVSLGTGKPNVIGMDNQDVFQKIFPLKLLEVLKGIATDCEAISERMALRFTKLPNFYFRLNVDQGLQHVSLEEWKKLTDVEVHSCKYLESHDVDKKVDQLVQVLQGQPCVLPTAELSKFCSPAHLYHMITHYASECPCTVTSKCKSCPTNTNTSSSTF
jgi:hypothetical protein